MDTNSSFQAMWDTRPPRIPKEQGGNPLVGGICEGIGARYNVDVTFVRVVFCCAGAHHRRRHFPVPAVLVHHAAFWHADIPRTGDLHTERTSESCCAQRPQHRLAVVDRIADLLPVRHAGHGSQGSISAAGRNLHRVCRVVASASAHANAATFAWSALQIKRVDLDYIGALASLQKPR